MAQRDRARTDAGAAVPEFVLVVGLLLFLVFGVIQVALLLHVRDVVTAVAAEGARFEANAGAATGSGAIKAHGLLDQSLGARVREPLHCSSSRARPSAALPPVVTVVCKGELRLWLLPITVSVEQTGHALLEGA